MKIDAHHHFWKYDPAEYGWIGDEMAAIRRDFLPGDLEQEIRAAGIEGVVSVQARTSLEETCWLLELAAQHEFIRGVVGWVPLAEASLREEMEALRDHGGYSKLKAVREVCQGQAEGFMLRPDFLAGIGALRDFGLAYDILIFEHQLVEATQLVDRFPEQVFVLDHVAKPRIREQILEPWSQNMRELARRENVFCKLSGMVTEAQWPGWTVEQLRPYADLVLEVFGPQRTMFGSDWPVCLVASGYALWVETVRQLIGALSETEQAQIFGETAARAYHLEPA